MPSDATTATRAARNESIFREVNEHLEAAAVSAHDDRAAFVCECVNIACAEVVTLALPEYERIRSIPNRFFVVPEDDHVDWEHERVVARYETHWVVEKVEMAGAIAEQLDEQTADPPSVVEPVVRCQ